jgi:predicted DNA-binding protein with PD1-like motif
MKWDLLDDKAGRTYALIYEIGEEVMQTLLAFAKQEKLAGSSVSGIGALSDVILAYFDWDQKKYVPNPIPEQVELVSLLGDISLDPAGEPALHVHVVVGKRDGTAYGGHLVAAHVRPTLEMIITESPEHLQRKIDPATGLATIQGTKFGGCAPPLSASAGSPATMSPDSR